MGRRTLLILLLALATAGLFFVLTKPKPVLFPFSHPIQRRADYRPASEGVTLYPTEGPFGVGVIQTIAAGRGEALFVGTYGEGLFRSEDGGAHWAPANLGLKDKFIVSLVWSPEGTLFAGTIRAGLFKSRDAGRHWVSANPGLENTDVQAIAFLPPLGSGAQTGGGLFAGTGQGVFVSRDEGGRWAPFNEGLGSVLVRSLVVGKDRTLYAATQGEGIFARAPGADRWTRLVSGFNFEGIEESVIRSLVFGKNGDLYAGTLGAGIFRSRDGGRHWERASVGLSSLSIRSLAVDGEGNLYAGVGSGAFYSRDDGAHWFPLESGLPESQIDSFVTNEKGEFYVGTGAGLFKGRIGAPWRPLHEGLRIAPIRTLDYGEDEVTVGTDGKGVFMSRGDNWVSNNIGLVNLSVGVMARGKTFLYIVTEEGLFRKQHGSIQWDAIETAPSPVRSLAVDENETVYAGGDAGLFSSSDHGRSWTPIAAVGSGPVVALAVRGKELLAVSDALWVKSEGGWKRLISKEGAPFRFVVWGEGEAFFAGTDRKIWRGDLKGAWREAQGNLPEGARITSLAVDPRNQEVLYVGTDRGLFWSEDGAVHWRLARLYQGERFEKRVNSVLPTSTGVVWVATETEGALLGIAKIAGRNSLQRWLWGSG